MITLIVLFPIVAAIFTILLILGFKKEKDEEGKDFMKNAYIYLVLFATLMMSIGGSVGAFMALADIVSPAPYYQSFEEYKQWGAEAHLGNKEAVNEKSDEELKISYDAMVERETQQAKQRAVNSLIKSFGWIVIPLPVFIFFQRILRRKES